MDAVWTALAATGPVGLIALAVVAVWRGWLIPSAQFDRVERLLTQRAEDFKAAWLAAEERGRVRDEQVEKLLTNAVTVEQLLRSIVRVAEAKEPTT